MSELFIHLAKDLLKMVSEYGFFRKSSGSLFQRRIAFAGKEFEEEDRRHLRGLIWPWELDRVLMFDFH